MFLDEIVSAHRRGVAIGIPSICSAHPAVIKTAMRTFSQYDKPLLIESTCNQVNQEGGYTGMKPPDFVAYIYSLAEQVGYPKTQLFLGGDHLGPYPWRKENAESAMKKAQDLVKSYVRAGYQKIHLDASMPLGDDNPDQPLPVEVIAERTAQLAQAAVEAAISQEIRERLRFVIGSEVPPPGGTAKGEKKTSVTSVSHVQESLVATDSAFRKKNLHSLLDQMIAVVVEAGVEFGDDFILDYKPEQTHSLAQWIESKGLVFEAHSTDYQTKENLRAMVCNHFGILKVGPALTFAYRQVVFALAHIEEHLCSPEEQSHLLQVIERVMIENPHYWQDYYRGTPSEQALKRKFNLSDRIRYYWSDPAIQAALEKLNANLCGKKAPLGLLKQYCPHLYTGAQISNSPLLPERLIEESIRCVLDDYAYACWALSKP